MDEENKDNNGTPRRPRTKEDFYMFCNYALEYAKYDEMVNTNGSVLDSATKNPVNNESCNSETIDVVSVPESISLTQEAVIPHEPEPGTETFRSSWITCCCGNHLVTRLMLQCSTCRIWVRLSSSGANINNIADNFQCILCDPTKSKQRARKSRHKKSRKHHE